MRNLSRHTRRYATKPVTITNTSPQARKRQMFPELSNLTPLAPGTVKHVSLQRTEPASVSRMIFSTVAPGGFLQPDYKLVQRYGQCPSINDNRLFNAKLVPHELLAHVETGVLPPFLPSPSPYSTKFGPEGDKIRYRSKMNKPHTIYASLLIVGSKAKVHDHAVKRRTIGRRIREALRLIVIRGARASKDGNSIMFNPEDTGEERWLVKGWSYVFFPTLEAYRVPWPSLISTVRESLTKLKALVNKLSEQVIHAGSPSYQTRRGSPSRRPNPMRHSSPTPPHKTNVQSDASRIIRTATIGTRNIPQLINKDQKPPSSRSYSTTVNREEGMPPRKVDMRAEVILGTHNSTSFWEIDNIIQTEILEYPQQEPEQHLVDPMVADVQSIWEYEKHNLRDEIHVDHSYAGAHDEDAEGWVVAGSHLPEDGDDLGIPHLLDSFNTPRFYPPHLPHHAGRGYERNMRTLWKNESKEAIRAKFETAAVERKKKRKVLRERWNQVPIEWISMLRRREEKRLENMYGCTLGQGHQERNSNKPWWAPNVGDLGWDDRANIGAHSSAPDPESVSTDANDSDSVQPSKVEGMGADGQSSLDEYIR